MPNLGIIYGLFLVGIGVFGYAKSGGASVTALIPAFLGVPVVILSWFAKRPRFTKIGMHICVVIALAGFAATAKDALGFISGKVFANELAAYSKTFTCLLSLLFFLLSVADFARVRRAKKQ